MSATQTPPSVVRFASSSFSLRLIAAAIILLFFYYAAGVVITLLFSILLAYFLDPAVEFLERFRLPRTAGAMVMVLILTAVMVAVGYGLWTRAADFSALKLITYGTAPISPDLLRRSIETFASSVMRRRSRSRPRPGGPAACRRPAAGGLKSADPAEAPPEASPRL